MANNYGLFFTNKNTGAVIRLPVNPEGLPASRDTANDDLNVLGIGPIMVPRIPELKKIEIASYFPGRPDLLTLTAGSFQPPSFYISFFEGAMLNKEILTYTPVRYYEDGEQYLLDDNGYDVLVVGFEYEERGAETGDFYYTLNLSEYRDYTPAKMQLQSGSNQTGGAAVATTEPTRSIPKNQLVVGSVVIANSKYYASSNGDEPHGNGNGRRCKVSRIEASRSYPVHITDESGGALGWIKKDSLQVVDDE